MIFALRDELLRGEEEALNTVTWKETLLYHNLQSLGAG